MVLKSFFKDGIRECMGRLKISWEAGKWRELHTRWGKNARGNFKTWWVL